MLSYAIEAGKELIEVKRSLAHGEFQAWCKNNLVLSYRQAAAYMRAAKSADLRTFDPHDGLDTFLAGFAEPRPTTTPTLDHETAQRVLKLARMANGGNEYEEGPHDERKAAENRPS